MTQGDLIKVEVVLRNDLMRSQQTRSSRECDGNVTTSAKEETFDMENISPENVSGFVVGEGCFYVESGHDPKYRLGYRIRPAFCIELRSDDKSILEAVRYHLGCGNLYELDFGRYKGYENKNWKPHVKYRVSNFLDITQKVVPFFEKYSLFGKKKKAFEIFREIVQRMEKKEHLQEDRLQEMQALVKELSTLNKKGL